MANMKTVYKGKYPELVDFEITSDDGSSLDITMSGGAITLVISATNFHEEYLERDKPKLLKNNYSMKVGRTAAITDTPSVTIKF
jgi:hypothetical protein